MQKHTNSFKFLIGFFLFFSFCILILLYLTEGFSRYRNQTIEKKHRWNCCALNIALVMVMSNIKVFFYKRNTSCMVWNNRTPYCSTISDNTFILVEMRHLIGWTILVKFVLTALHVTRDVTIRQRQKRTISAWRYV